MYRNLNSKQRDVMINCLLLANHKGKKWEWKGEIFECRPGQFITSLPSLKRVCAKDVSVQNIRTALKKLIKWNFLEQETTKTGRLITIINWQKYQESNCKTNSETNRQVTGDKPLNNGDNSNGNNKTNSHNNRQSTDNQQTTNSQLTSNKNVKNDNNVKNDKELNNNSPDSTSPDVYEPKYEEDSMPYKAACYLRDRVLENNPRQPVPEKTPKDMEDWATEMDRLFRLGPVGAKNKGYSWQEIGKLIDWCQDHHFWSGNILSAGKFREQIVKLENQMKSDSNKNRQAQKDDLLGKLYAEAEG